MKKKLLFLFTLIFFIGIISVHAETNTYINIDNPKTNQEESDTLRILGWVMSTTNNNIKIYIDNDEIANVPRQVRQDVINDIKGYGDISTNPTPGFDKNIDITQYGYGGHNLKVEVYDKNNKLIQSETRTFIRTAPKTKINIDMPSSTGEYTDTIRILGWVMSTSNNTIKAYIDNQEITDISRQVRQDVVNAVKGYGDISTNPTPGFDKNIDITQYGYGGHNLKVEVYDSNNKIIQSETRTFIRTAPKTKINIDIPSSTGEYTDTIRILGWVMSTSNNTIKAYIDNQEITDISRQVRQDVVNTIKGYGDISTNKTPGFDKYVDITNLSYGSHNLRIEAYDSNNKLIQSETRTFQKKTPKTKINIDMPSSTGGYTDTIRILGWVMSTANTNIKAYIDNQEITDISRQVRQDVVNTIKGYGDISTNKTPGFDKYIDITNLSYGSHNLRIEAYDSNNKLIQSETRTFQKKTPKTKINIDMPSSTGGYTDTIRILGWVMSTANTNIKAYIDNQEITDIPRQVRQDVVNAIKGYGDISTNPTPGFDKYVDISKFIYGTHNLKIEVYDSNNKLIQTTTKTFKKVKPKAKINIDYPSSNQDGTNIRILGWYLTNTVNAKAEIYIDSNKIDYNNFLERQDVYKVYKGQYGYETSKPGFDINYDGTNLSDGKHTILVQIVSTSNNQIILSQIKSFTLKKVKGTIYIDHLEQATKQRGYVLEGWEMSTQEESYFKIYVDNALVQTTINRSERNDVINSIKNYGSVTENPNPGFNTIINVSNINIGRHIVKIELYSKYNELINSLSRSIYMYSKSYSTSNNITTRTYETPYYNQNDGRWKNIQYGFSKFGPRGCAPTAMAMAFSGIKGIEILPNNVADYLYYNTREFNKDVAGTSGLGIIYASDAFGIKRTGINSKEELDKALQSGKIVFAAMGPGIYGTPLWNHAIILKGYSNGNTFSSDPLDPNKNIWVSTNTVWSQRSTDWDDYRGGSVFYGLESYY